MDGSPSLFGACQIKFVNNVALEKVEEVKNQVKELENQIKTIDE